MKAALLRYSSAGIQYKVSFMEINSVVAGPGQGCLIRHKHIEIYLKTVYHINKITISEFMKMANPG